MFNYDSTEIVYFVFTVIVYFYWLYVVTTHLLIVADNDDPTRLVFTVRHLLEHVLLLGVLAWLPFHSFMLGYEDLVLRTVELVTLLAVSHHLLKEIQLSEIFE